MNFQKITDWKRHNKNILMTNRQAQGKHRLLFDFLHCLLNSDVSGQYLSTLWSSPNCKSPLTQSQMSEQTDNPNEVQYMELLWIARMAGVPFLFIRPSRLNNRASLLMRDSNRLNLEKKTKSWAVPCLKEGRRENTRQETGTHTITETVT